MARSQSWEQIARLTSLTVWVLRAGADSPQEAVLLAPSGGALNSERVKHRCLSQKE